MSKETIVTEAHCTRQLQIEEVLDWAETFCETPRGINETIETFAARAAVAVEDQIDTLWELIVDLRQIAGEDDDWASQRVDYETTPPDDMVARVYVAMGLGDPPNKPTT